MTHMNRFRGGLLMPALVALLSSCGDSGNAAVSAKGTHFTKEMVKGCELISADLVAATFPVPVQDLKQTKIMGCIYTWSNEHDQLQVSVMRPRAHKDVTAAISWFATATKNRSVEEVQAELDRVSERLESGEELDTPAKKSMVQVILKASAAKAVVYKEVSNIGDEARAGEDGSLWLRVGNLTMTVSAYHGAKQPETQLSGLGVKEMIAVAEQEASEWQAKTASQRLQESTQLANAIIATL